MILQHFDIHSFFFFSFQTIGSSFCPVLSGDHQPLPAFHVMYLLSDNREGVGFRYLVLFNQMLLSRVLSGDHHSSTTTRFSCNVSFVRQQSSGERGWISTPCLNGYPPLSKCNTHCNQLHCGPKWFCSILIYNNFFYRNIGSPFCLVLSGDHQPLPTSHVMYLLSDNRTLEREGGF